MKINYNPCKNNYNNKKYINNRFIHNSLIIINNRERKCLNN